MNRPSIDMTMKEAIGSILLALAMLVLSTRLATFIHEVFGHAAVALLAGEEVQSIEISLFGGGYVSSYFYSENILLNLLFSLSGIFLNLATGFLILFFSKRLLKANIFINLLLTYLLVTSLNGALAYFIMGIYYSYGDPVTWIYPIPPWYSWCWIIGLALAPLSSYLTTKVYLQTQERSFPATTIKRRFGVTMIALGIPTIIYALLFLSTQQHFVATDAHGINHQREKEKIIVVKKERIKKNIRQSSPSLTEKEIAEIAGKTKVVVNDEEVPTKFPLIYILILMYLIGGILAIIKTSPHQKNEHSSKPFRAMPYAFVLLLASITIFVLICINGQIYPL